MIGVKSYSCEGIFVLWTVVFCLARSVRWPGGCGAWGKACDWPVILVRECLFSAAKGVNAIFDDRVIPYLLPISLLIDLWVTITLLIIIIIIIIIITRTAPAIVGDSMANESVIGIVRSA